MRAPAREERNAGGRYAIPMMRGRATKRRNDVFELFDLRVEVVAGERPMVCNHQVGDSFELRGENLLFPPGQSFPIYPLAALLPLLPAKQRPTHANDWMTTDALIACPDPNCGGLFRITRLRKRRFRHSQTTATPLPPSPRARGRSRGGRGRPRARRNR